MPKGIPRNKTVEQAVLHRLKIARGHLDKVISMAEKGEYCIDIINQSIAVQAALKETDNVILKNHMQTCVSQAMKKGANGEIIDEIMKVMEKK